ncbi:MAG: PadR family transcriptional regulator [Bacteroidota bacterium]
MKGTNTQDKLENTKAQMRKGILELCVLSIISEQEVYPTDIINQLKKYDLIVKEGTLYPLLSRLKNSGLLAYKWKEVEGKGPPRKYYLLTEHGASFLHGLLGTWDKLVNAVQETTKNITTNE